jgi:Ca2+-binding EF-hand superfamily protein
MSTIDLDKFLTEDKINAIFNCFDIDHSGSLNFQSIKNAFTKFGKEISDDEVMKIIKKHDNDGSCSIDYEEFKNMMTLLKNPKI